MVASKFYFPYLISKNIFYLLLGTSIKLISNYNHETAPILMSNVRCSGNESRLTECPHSPGGNGSFATLNCHGRFRKLKQATYLFIPLTQRCMGNE